jgi:hypothetical protein
MLACSTADDEDLRHVSARISRAAFWYHPRVAENPRPPVAIRIVRPYANEDEFLEAELETIGKTSVILIGAHPRPTGVILRFEVTLTSGATVLRGEGRVLAHKENAFRGQPGLSLRFTRLDPRSKALVDRATSLREQRAAPMPRSQPPMAAPASGGRVSAVPPSAPSAPPPMPSAPPPTRPLAPSRPPAPDPAIAQALTAATPPPARAARPEPARPSSPPQLSPPPPPHVHVEDHPTYVETRSDAPMPIMTQVPSTRPRGGGPIAAPENREALLARLRDRRASMPAARVEQILAQRRG